MAGSAYDIFLNMMQGSLYNIVIMFKMRIKFKGAYELKGLF